MIGAPGLERNRAGRRRVRQQMAAFKGRRIARRLIGNSRKRLKPAAAQIGWHNGRVSGQKLRNE